MPKSLAFLVKDEDKKHPLEQLRKLRQACRQYILKFYLRTCEFPYGLVVTIRRSHRRGPGSIPGVGRINIILFIYLFLVCFNPNAFFNCCYCIKILFFFGDIIVQG